MCDVTDSRRKPTRPANRYKTPVSDLKIKKGANKEENLVTEHQTTHCLCTARKCLPRGSTRGRRKDAGGQPLFSPEDDLPVYLQRKRANRKAGGAGRRFGQHLGLERSGCVAVMNSPTSQGSALCFPATSPTEQPPWEQSWALRPWGAPHQRSSTPAQKQLMPFRRRRQPGRVPQLRPPTGGQWYGPPMRLEAGGCSASSTDATGRERDPRQTREPGATLHRRNDQCDTQLYRKHETPRSTHEKLRDSWRELKPLPRDRRGNLNTLVRVL